MRVLSFGIVIGIAAIAAGQPAQDPTVAAKQYVDAGLAAQKNGDYDTAVEMYEKANAMAPHPVLLFNIGQAHRLASAAMAEKNPAAAATHRDAARDFYRKFLDTKPDGDLEVTARGWLAKLDQQWADEHPKEEAERRAAEERAREEAIQREQAKLEAERKQREARDQVERQRIGTAVNTEKRDAELRKASALEWTGIGAGGAGLIATGLGIYFGVEARRQSDQLTKDNVFDVARINRGNALERDMTIAYVAGGALIVGGAVTYWLGWRAGRAAEHLVVAPATGGATAGVRGSW